ncbi:MULTISPECIES: glycerate kinase [unclassified Olleya]|jgi:glycerate kinase|uniref:glycerate kinase n=1 Tax=unclassified Olleya TaxID=2615019 RepID=UPI0011A883F7|nr:glycerate kinase [Olleya sp. Hel_I_94]TVZ47301.1 glycerate kinase [Olleya sp. Hel_I_94]|tara:strand:+ start:74229 stop:75362 length:1134 start_codon:yes stop_codon:yes gene_type:complete
MKIVIAPDKFKNSLTSLEFCNIVEKQLKKELPYANIVKLPLADGGDGTIDIVKHYLDGETIKTTVCNPLFTAIEASYIYAPKYETAFIEMAEASGLKLLKPEQLDCKITSTFGTGQLILDALNKGAKKIILGIGGSATNDCGIGMATALGYRFLDKKGEIVNPIGKNLSSIKSIDVSQANPQIFSTDFKIACDVTNPLYGKKGAAYVYAAQKGANHQDILLLNKGLKDFSKLISQIFKIDPQSIPGSGAAGGMGIASKIFLNGTLESGNKLIKQLSNFDNQISNADWIITGEGKLDNQTLSGKTIQGVLDTSTKNNINVAVFCGAIDINEKALKNMGINYASQIINEAKNLDDAMQNTNIHLKTMTKKFIGHIKQLK